MPGAFLQDDLPFLFASSDFGEADGTGSPTWKGTAVSGIFDDDDVEVQMGEGVAEIVPQPMFSGSASDFVGIADGDAMVIRGETFTVKNWKIEAGVIEIFLSRGA